MYQFGWNCIAKNPFALSAIEATGELFVWPIALKPIRKPLSCPHDHQTVDLLTGPKDISVVIYHKLSPSVFPQAREQNLEAMSHKLHAITEPEHRNTE